MKGDDSPYYDFQGSGEQGSVVMKFTQYFTQYHHMIHEKTDPMRLFLTDDLHPSSSPELQHVWTVGYSWSYRDVTIEKDRNG
jgi:hypothetical protein